jgi:DnaJ-class molecular chaperone
MTCYKCFGTKLNKKGLTCKRCGGAGSLKGEFFSGIGAIIKEEITKYCNIDFKSLLEQELK